MDHPDELLPLSRRLDWRFLLPDPALNHVVYSGPKESLLLGALNRLSGDVVSGDSGAHGDLAVMVNPSLSEFAQALTAASSFYIELYRPAWWQRVLHAAAPRAYLRLARAQHMQAQAYWHYPDFDAATRIIPLSVLPPLLHVIGKDGHDLNTRVKTAGAALLLKTGLLARAVSCLSIVGYRP